jgi:hypothetical protein
MRLEVAVVLASLPVCDTPNAGVRSVSAAATSSAATRSSRAWSTSRRLQERKNSSDIGRQQTQSWLGGHETSMLLWQ